ncbi:hypothetical protein SFRURICE_013076 [Spodoptera frugiperda]|nr:hypothetical protein SFRURICE_013076 [Spodoptera frugiperda]
MEVFSTVSRLNLLAFVILCFLISSSHSYEVFVTFFPRLSIEPTALLAVAVDKTCSNCPNVFYPVCAEDKNTYVNECKMKCYYVNVKNTTKLPRIVRDGPCKMFP